MATQDLVPGSKFRLLRENDTTPGTFDFMCLAATKTFSRGKDFEDATLPDCDSPDTVMVRRSTIRARSWDISFSGKVDAKRFEKLEADYNSDATKKYQLLTALTSAAGGKTYTGLAWMGPLEMTSSDGGMVAFTASLRGDGPLTTAAVT